MQVNRVMTADALMLVCGLIMHLNGNFWVARESNSEFTPPCSGA